MSSNPDALVRFWKEAKAAIGADLELGGIYANKRGYHNRRDGLPSTDYSVRLATDKRGPADKASAIDLTFNSAQHGDYRTIAKYSKRLYDAMSKGTGAGRDPRLFRDGKPVIREFFGNIDADETVEGYTFHNSKTGKAQPASSDSSHLWHIHISFHREFCDNWDAVEGVLDVLLARAPKPPPPKDDMFSEKDRDMLEQLHSVLLRIDSLREKEADGTGETHSAGYYLGHADRNAYDSKAILQQKVLPALAALAEGASPSVKSNVEKILKGNQ